MDAESPYLARADDGLIPSTARPRVAIDEDDVTNFLRSVLFSKLRFFVLGVTEKSSVSLVELVVISGEEKIPKAIVPLGIKRKLSRRFIFKSRDMLYFMWIKEESTLGCCFSSTLVDLIES